MELLKRLLREEQPDVAVSLNNLAKLYQAQGRYSEAQPKYVQALAIFEQRLGTKHPTTVGVRANLERCRAQGSGNQSKLKETELQTRRTSLWKNYLNSRTYY